MTQAFRSNEEPADRIELRDTLAVEVADLEALLRELDCRWQESGRELGLVLYLDGLPVPDVEVFPPTDPSLDLLHFPLRRTEESREVWAALLGKPGLRPREVAVSVGIEDRFAIGSDASIELVVLPRRWLVFWALLFGGLLIGFLALAHRSDLLRDAVAPADPAARRPYSLARMQAAWWFFLVLASYLLIALVTGDFSTSITGTVLVLLGISAGTTVGSAFIDAGHDTLGERARREAARDVVAKRVAKLEAAPATSEAVAAEYQVRRSQLQKLENRTEGLLLDILSDANGVSFHRFQMAAWTIVLGIVFGAQVYRELAMPQFSETLLSLMGISAGTFLGLKIPEPTVPAEPPAEPPA